MQMPMFTDSNEAILENENSNRDLLIPIFDSTPMPTANWFLFIL